MTSDIASPYRVEPGSKFRLSDRDPAAKPEFTDRKGADASTERDAVAINDLQDRLFAERTRALLVILQGIDTAGKDGTIRTVFNHTGALGVCVTPFGKPTDVELAHDYLWRPHKACPRRGFIGIFNRSHYEDVLIGSVRRLAPKEAIKQRYGQINDFEKMLVENGTTILKFMLHISKDEQRERLQARLDEPKHRWKFNPGDLEDRKLWDAYQAAYEKMLTRCSTQWAPWHVIPSDRKWARSAIIAGIVRETLEQMNPQYPKPDWKPGDFTVE